MLLRKCVNLKAYLLILFVFPSLASAHLMVAQQGTIKVFEDGAFLVLSVPVTTFEGVDDDGDGKLSNSEFSEHKAAIASMVHDKLSLVGKDDKKHLQGMMMSLVVPEHLPSEPSDQLVIMGRFALQASEAELALHLGLFGKNPTEQVFTIATTRVADTKKHSFEISPKQLVASLFPAQQN